MAAACRRKNGQEEDMSGVAVQWACPRNMSGRWCGVQNVRFAKRLMRTEIIGLYWSVSLLKLCPAMDMTKLTRRRILLCTCRAWLCVLLPPAVHPHSNNNNNNINRDWVSTTVHPSLFDWVGGQTGRIIIIVRGHCHNAILQWLCLTRVRPCHSTNH